MYEDGPSDAAAAQQQRWRLRRTAVRAVLSLNRVRGQARYLPSRREPVVRPGKVDRFTAELVPVLVAYETQSWRLEDHRKNKTTKGLDQLERAKKAEEVKGFRTRNLINALQRMPDDSRFIVTAAVDDIISNEYSLEETILKNISISDADVIKYLEEMLLDADEDLRAYHFVGDVGQRAKEFRREFGLRKDHRHRLTSNIFRIYQKFTGRNLGQFQYDDPDGERGHSKFLKFMFTIAGDEQDTFLNYGVRPRLGRSGVRATIDDMMRPGSVDTLDGLGPD